MVVTSKSTPCPCSLLLSTTNTSFPSAASKAGLQGMGRNLATRLASSGITVNDVAPAVSALCCVSALQHSTRAQ